MTMLSKEELEAIAARAKRLREKDGHDLSPSAEDREALLSHIEEMERANSARPDYPVFCGECGRAHILDTVLPSEIWNQIASPNDLLCVVCIDARLKASGLTAEAQFFYSGDALQSALYADHMQAPSLP